MTVYPGMHCGCTLIVHRPLITLSKRRYVNEKTRYKTLISIPLELTYPVKIFLRYCQPVDDKCLQRCCYSKLWYYYFYWWVPAALNQVCYFTEHYIAYKGMTSHQKYVSINMRDRTWSMCLSIVVSLCELEHEYMEYTFVHCCFCVWVRIRIHGVSVCA